MAGGDAKVDNFERKALAGQERVLCLDAKTGKEIWKHEYPVTYAISYPAGPRCTPIVDAGRLYTLGAEGKLICFDPNSGKVQWERDLPKDYATKSALWGYAAHPLIDGQKLICVVGGEGSHTVAFDKTTGKEIWKFGTAPEQGYSPPTIIKAAGVRQLILANPSAINAVDPETGKQLWTVPYAATSGSIIMSPIVVGEYLFIGGYSNHNLLLKLNQDKPGVTEVARDKTKRFVSRSMCSLSSKATPFLEWTKKAIWWHFVCLTVNISGAAPISSAVAAQGVKQPSSSRTRSCSTSSMRKGNSSSPS